MINWQELTKNISAKDMEDFGEFRETLHANHVLSGFVVSKGSGKPYAIQIQMDTEYFAPNSRVKVYCNCDNFKFQWAYVLYKHNALIAPQNFVLLPPKQTNPNMDVGCCKHIKVFLELANKATLKHLNMTKGQI